MMGERFTRLPWNVKRRAGNSMFRLSKRLKKLEAIIQMRSSPSVSTAEVDRIALGKLSLADRNLLQEARATRGLDLSISHPETWKRWEDALEAAIEETDYPIRFRATDWGL